MKPQTLHRTAGTRHIQTAWMATLTFLSALFFAWSGHMVLGPTFAGHPVDPSTFTLRVPPAEPGSRSPEDDITISAVIVDGARLRWQETGLEGPWVERLDQVPKLVHLGGQPAATITFRGKSALGSATGSGKILLERDGEPLHEVSLGSPARTWRMEVLFDWGNAKPPVWTFWAFLAVAMCAAGLLRPWVPGRTGEGWILCHAAGLHVLVWATHLVTTMPDSAGYVHEVANLASGTPGHFPPGTSILVGLAGLIPFGLLGLKVTLIQHALITLSVLWVFRLLRMCLTEGVAFLTGLVLGSSWCLLTTPQAILSESVTCFGMAGTVYYGARYRESGSLASAILAGLLAGWAGLARVIPLMGSTLAFFCLHLLPPSWRGLRRFALVTAVSIAVLLSPVAWHWARHGDRRLTTSDGIHMFYRVVEAQGRLAEHGPMTHVLLQILDYADPRGQDVFRVYETLKQKGLDPTQAGQLLKAVSIEAVLEAPEEYVVATLGTAWLQYHFVPWAYFLWYGENGLVEVEDPPVADFTRSCLEWGADVMEWETYLWERATWLALAGMALLFFLRQWTIMLAMACLVVGCCVGNAMCTIAQGRYSEPMVPFMIALAAVPLDLLVRSVPAMGRIVKLGRRPARA